MKIFILRHGMTTEAEADEYRELGEKGVTEVEDVVRLRQCDLRGITRIYSSPLLRVKQTLQVAARVLGIRDAIVESDDLKTGSRLNEIVNFVTDLDFEAGDVLVSSHQSCTSILVLWLTGEDVLIPNGSLLAIDIEKAERGAGTILWQESRDGSKIKKTSAFVDQF